MYSVTQNQEVAVPYDLCTELLKKICQSLGEGAGREDVGQSCSIPRGERGGGR